MPLTRMRRLRPDRLFARRSRFFGILVIMYTLPEIGLALLDRSPAAAVGTPVPVEAFVRLSIWATADEAPKANADVSALSQISCCSPKLREHTPENSRPFQKQADSCSRLSLDQ